MPGAKSNSIGLYRDEKVHIWGGNGIVVCHCHPKYELFSPEISVIPYARPKIEVDRSLKWKETVCKKKAPPHRAVLLAMSSLA